MDNDRAHDRGSDEELVALLQRAVDDEREGRLVRCGDEQELRAFLQGGLHREAS